jgi:hypothetical protein
MSTPINPFPAPSARDWVEDFPHENGNYENHCVGCHLSFIGHKRRHICKVCSERAAAPTDAQIEAAALKESCGINRNAIPAVRECFAGHIAWLEAQRAEWMGEAITLGSRLATLAGKFEEAQEAVACVRGIERESATRLTEMLEAQDALRPLKARLKEQSEQLRATEAKLEERRVAMLEIVRALGLGMEGVPIDQVAHKVSAAMDERDALKFGLRRLFSLLGQAHAPVSDAQVDSLRELVSQLLEEKP